MRTFDSSQMFSNPDQETVVGAAWERFLGGQQPGNILRDPVNSSWQRCLVSNVDPTRRSGPPPVPASSLHLLRQSCSDLLDLSAPVMAHAREFLAETGMLMVLTDPDGTILAVEGDNQTVDDAESIQLIPGVTWSEMVCGTNAIGTALELGQPVQIHSAEHYCEGIKRWTCSATVIRHPLDNEILGVINVSGLSGTFSRHTLGLVVTTASRIESRLTARAMELRYWLLESTIDKLSSNSSDGTILFDPRGHPIKANDVAQTILVRRGGPPDLSGIDRIRALSLDRKDSASLASELPCWMQPEWLHPVSHGGQRIGTLLVLPMAGSASRVAAPDRSAIGTTDEHEARAFASLMGNSTQLREAVAKAAQLAKSRVSILLTGETGVGKEEFAHGIHRASAAHSGPFVAVNCGGLSRELLLSELFGYAEGAFTGARRGGQCGKVEAANGGTLFLDEIGEMPLDLQPHLLRVLEQGEIYRLGENQPRKVDFRLLAATHRDLRKEVAEGRFRMDLFYRIVVTSIHIPCLRERPEDIRTLAEHFLECGVRKHGLGHHRLGSGVIEALEAYAWPGNVRELRNAVESMLLTSTSTMIESDSLPLDIRGEQRGDQATSERSAQCSKLHMTHVERGVIVDAIRTASGNLTTAAKLLGIAKSTLYLKLDRYGLRDEVSGLRERYPG